MAGIYAYFFLLVIHTVTPSLKVAIHYNVNVDCIQIKITIDT